MFLASVVVDFHDAATIRPGRLADAFMAELDVVTVKVPGEGASAECRADVQAPTRELARDRAAELAARVGEAIGLEPCIVAIKLQTERERLTALEGARGYGPFGFTAS
jgi:hypothetical protein